MIQDLGTYKTWWLKNVKDFKAGSIYSIEIEYNTTVDIEVYLNFLWENLLVNSLQCKTIIKANNNKHTCNVVTNFYQGTNFTGPIQCTISPSNPNDLKKPSGLMAAVSGNKSTFEKLDITNLIIKKKVFDIDAYLGTISCEELEPTGEVDKSVILHGFHYKEDGLGAHLCNLYKHVFKDFKHISFNRPLDRLHRNFIFLSTLTNFMPTTLKKHEQDFKWLKLYKKYENAHIRQPLDYKNCKFVHVSGIDLESNIIEYNNNLTSWIKNTYDANTYWYLMWENTGVSTLKDIIPTFDNIVVTNSWLTDCLKEEYPETEIYKVEHIASFPNFINNPEPNKFVYGYSGGFWDRKKVDNIIDAFNACKTENDYLKLHSRRFVNTPVMMNQLKEHIAQEPNNIILQHKTLDNEEYQSWWELLNCYVFLSAGESYSITPRQALLQGIPVILSKNTAHLDLKDIPGILWVESGDFSDAYYSGRPDDVGSIGMQYNPDMGQAIAQIKEVKKNYGYWKEEAQKAIPILKQQVDKANIKASWYSLLN